MLGMDVDMVVPGHGPLTDKAGVAAVRDYLAFVDAEATARHDAGSTPRGGEGDRDLIGAATSSAGWGEAGRIAVNVETVYRTLDPAHRRPDVVEQFRRMAAPRPPPGGTAGPRRRRRRRRAGGPGARRRRVGLDVVVVGPGTTVDRRPTARGATTCPTCPTRASPPSPGTSSCTATAGTRSGGRTASSTTARCASTSAGGVDVRRRATGGPHMPWGSTVVTDAATSTPASSSTAPVGSAARSAVAATAPADRPTVSSSRERPSYAGDDVTLMDFRHRRRSGRRRRSATSCPSPTAGSSRRRRSRRVRRSTRRLLQGVLGARASATCWRGGRRGGHDPSGRPLPARRPVVAFGRRPAAPGHGSSVASVSGAARVAARSPTAGRRIRGVAGCRCCRTRRLHDYGLRGAARPRPGRPGDVLRPSSSCP